MARSPLTAALILLAVLALAAAAVDGWPEWQRLNRISGSRAVPGEAVGSTRFARALGELGLLHPVPRGRRPDAPAASLGPIPARAGSTPDQLSLGRPGGRHLLRSYALDGYELAERAPVVSLLVPPDELEQMERTTFVRGRESERRAFVGFFDDGVLGAGSGAGVRIHGGATRHRRSWLGYRLTARRGYGAPTFSPTPFPGQPDFEPKRLVLRPNRGRDRHHHMWHFSSPLAMDIARRIGVPTPRSRPVGLFINGRYEGVYELSDYLGPDFVEARFGIRDMILVRTKRNRYERHRSKVKEGPEEPYLEFSDWVRTAPKSSPPEEAGERVDLDNLYRWLIAVTFLDVRDTFQGALIRDLAAADGRWFWIAWDIEISFGLPQYPHQDGWRENSIDGLLESRRPDERRFLFPWLMESAEQRRRFLQMAVEALNHRVDADFLDERLAFYRDQAELFDLEDRVFLDELTDYLRNRPAAYRQHLRETLDAGTPRRLRVTGPPGSRLEIDGYATELPWQGEYFDGMTARLVARPGDALSIDGAPRIVGEDPVTITLLADRQVTLVPGG